MMFPVAEGLPDFPGGCCNGSSAGSQPASVGSNPVPPARFFFMRLHLVLGRSPCISEFTQGLFILPPDMPAEASPEHLKHTS